MKFQKGDPVKIVSCQFDISPMRSYIGKHDTIQEHYCRSDEFDWYILENDIAKFIWREDWLELVNEFSEINIDELLKEPL